jgi:hypothetical protein
MHAFLTFLLLVVACIGLDAGWVCVIGVVRKLSSPAPESSWSFLIDNYDGIVGVLVLAWTIVFGTAYWLITRPRAATD